LRLSATNPSNSCGRAAFGFAVATEHRNYGPLEVVQRVVIKPLEVDLAGQRNCQRK
jgi:hypothetical protein